MPELPSESVYLQSFILCEDVIVLVLYGHLSSFSTNEVFLRAPQMLVNAFQVHCVCMHFALSIIVINKNISNNYNSSMIFWT